MTARTGVVVVNFGASDLIEHNLAGLEPQLDADDVRVIVVDNRKTAADSAAMGRICAARGWTFLANDTNVGFGPAVNRGMAAAIDQGCSSLISLNPDASLTPEAVSALRTLVEERPDTVFAPTIVDSQGRPAHSAGVVDIVRGGLRPLAQARADTPLWLTGACLAMHPRLWSRLAGYDQDYFLYWEDVDLSYRAHQLGASVVRRDDVVAVHDAGGTQPGPNRKSAVYYHYNCRNRLVFAAKHLPWQEQLRWIVTTPMDVRRVLRRGGRSQYRRPWPVLWPVVTGCTAGLGWLLRSGVRTAVRRAPATGRPTARLATKKGQA